jgi:hypothetical protein
MGRGFLIGAIGLFSRRCAATVKVSVYWLIAIFLYYLVAARTTADGWAWHYHIFAIAPAALLIGAGADLITGIEWPRRARLWFALLAACLALAMAASAFWLPDPPQPASLLFRTLLVVCGVMGLAGTLVLEVRQIAMIVGKHTPHPLYDCGIQFRQAVPPGALIVTSGGSCTDFTGRPVAFDAPYMFYWMDRKGFAICSERQSISELRRLTQRGARYFVAEKKTIRTRAGFEEEVLRTFPRVRDCHSAYLFQLSSSPGAAPSPPADLRVRTDSVGVP